MESGGASLHGERPQADQDLVGVAALREWVTGETRDGARVFVLESDHAIDAVDGVARQEDVILMPAGSAASASPARVAHYSGGLSEVGDQLFFGERSVELQDYVAASFVQILGPTVVRFFDASGWRAFLDDADLARRTGVFPSALIDPRVLLADRGAITSPDETRTPHAIRIGADGQVRLGVQGDVIGHIDDLRTVLDRPLPRLASLGVAAEAWAEERGGTRRRVGRYLGAADLMTMLRLTNGDAKIAGFGWSFLDDGLADAEPETADPFLLETDGGLLLADTTTLRRQLLSPVTAGVVAALQTSSTPELAADRVSRAFAVSATHAADLCREAVAALGVHPGERVGESRSEGAAA